MTIVRLFVSILFCPCEDCHISSFSSSLTSTHIPFTIVLPRPCSLQLIGGCRGTHHLPLTSQVYSFCPREDGEMDASHSCTTIMPVLSASGARYRVCDSVRLALRNITQARAAYPTIKEWRKVNLRDHHSDRVYCILYTGVVASC